MIRILLAEHQRGTAGGADAAGRSRAVCELAFGSWVLLQPERINAYEQAVIQTLQTDEYQRGCLMEDRSCRAIWRTNPRCRCSLCVLAPSRLCLKIRVHRC